MGWISNLFSSQRIVRQAVDLADASIRGIGRWIDEQQLTDQERAELTQQRLEMYNRFILETMKQSGPQTLTRRILAFAVAAVYLLFVLVGAFSYVIDPGLAKWLVEWMDVTEFSIIAGGVFALYFGVHLVRGARQR